MMIDWIMSPYVVVVGSSNIDVSIFSKRFPKPGETVTGGIFKQSFGGKGANQAIASRRAGSETFFIGKLGQDSFGQQMIQNFLNEDISTEYILVDKKEASGVAFILLNDERQNMISVAPGANKNLTVKEILCYKSMIENAAVVIVQMEISTDVISKIFNLATNSIKILNPAPFKKLSLELLKKIDIITPNEIELLDLYNYLESKTLTEFSINELPKITKAIHQHGIKKIVITLGKNGCYISDSVNDKRVHVHGEQVKAQDTVGAGDCFNGVLASHLCMGEDLKTSAEYANIAASIAVTKVGAQISIPYKKEIETFRNRS